MYRENGAGLITSRGDADRMKRVTETLQALKGEIILLSGPVGDGLLIVLQGASGALLRLAFGRPVLARMIKHPRMNIRNDLIMLINMHLLRGRCQ